MPIATARQTSFVLLYFLLNNLFCCGHLIILEQSAPGRHLVSVFAGFTVNLQLQGSPVLTSVKIIRFLPAVAFLYAYLYVC